MNGREGEGGTFYELLEVAGDASFEEIEASYQRRLAYLDVESLALYSMLDGEEVGRERRSLEEAFRTLSDPERRSAYDRVIGMQANAGAVAGEAHSTYPLLMVPESESDPSVTQGRVGNTEPSVQAASGTAAAGGVTPRPTAGASGLREATRLVATSPASKTVPPPRLRRLKPNLEIALKPDTVFDGALLRRLRESAEASLKDLEEITKISKRYLAAIEMDDYGSLPAPVYARGFVCEYAKALGLDPQLVARSYMALYDKSRTGGVTP